MARKYNRNTETDDADVMEEVVAQSGGPQKQSMDSVMARAGQQMAVAEKHRKKLFAKYKEEEKKPMYLSPMYRPYFGNVMRVTVNGVSIFFKVDGSTQMIPKTFADELTSRRLKIDAILTKQSRMANVATNVETSPGELKLF